MGNYNSKYESYYSAIINSRKNKSSDYNNYKPTKGKSSFIFKRISRDLIGVFIMFLLVIGCKVIGTPKSIAVYKYSKNIVNTNLNYKSFITKVKSLDENRNYQEKIIDLIDKIKSRTIGGETIKEKIREKFTLPINGEEVSLSKEGLNIKTKKNNKILASFNGKIKECGINDKLKNYIVIDHGEGIETVYSNLDKILVNKNEVISKGQIIGEKNKGDREYIKFKILFMGVNRGFEKFIGMKN